MPRLIVLMPRSFSYSQITDRGQLVEISILNRGFKTEEAIEVMLNHTLKYELLGSNSQNALVKANKLYVPRVGPSEDVTVLLLVEPGTFKRDDIVQCLSKETKGLVVGKLEQVPPSGPQRVTILGMFVLFPALLYGMTYTLDYASDKFGSNPTTTSKVDKRAPVDIAGWRVPWFYVGTSELIQPLQDGRIKATVGDIARKGEIATVPITIVNGTQEVLKSRIALTSAFSSKRFKSYELTAEIAALTPGKSETKSIQVVIPQGSGSPSERTVFIDIRVENMYGQSVTLNAQRELP